jgi:hypothetical protein
MTAGKCPLCGEVSDYVNATVTNPAVEAEVYLEEGETEWEYDPEPRYQGEKHVQVTCPKCNKEIHSGDYDDVDAWIEDFLKGVE